MIIVQQKLDSLADGPSGETIELGVDRFRLLKRRWRGAARDGTLFGFELDRPLMHQDCFHVANGKRYVIAQEPERVLEVDLKGQALEGLQHVAWSIGNLHMPMQSLPSGVRVADDPAVRQLFDHLAVTFSEKEAVFEPIRSSSDIGHSHRHSHSHSG